MPNLGLSDGQPDLEALPQDMAQTPATPWSRYGAEATAAATQWANKAVTAIGASNLATMGYSTSYVPTELALPKTIPAEEANRIYGASGVRWNQPVNEDDAAWAATIAHEQHVRDGILSKTNPNPLLDFGAGVAGSMFDPVGVSVMTTTGGLGEAALGAMGWKAAAAEASGGLTLAGRVANLARYPVAGVIENAPYVGANAALTNLTGDDYSVLDGLRDLAIGATVHTTLHVAGRLLKNALKDPAADPTSEAAATAQAAPAGVQAPAAAELAPGEAPPVAERPPGPTTDFVPASGVPEVVDQMPTTSRRALTMLAAEDVERGDDVDVAPLIAQERQIPEVTASTGMEAPTMPSWRPVGEAPPTAVSPAGTATPVVYGLVEASDLVTSHHDDGAVNSDYPPELQPRGAPDVLGRPGAADGGPPIVSASGVVESGNGAVIEARRAMAEGGEKADAYRADLEAQGYDTSGMKDPVLVRARTQPLNLSQRSALAHEWNGPGHETQAGVDAAKIDDEGLAKLDGTRAGYLAFAKDLGEKIGSGAGRRIDAALMVKAYGDERLVAELLENPKLTLLGEGLRQAAPAWAQMRAAIARGEAHAGLDLTPALTSAMDLIRAARAGGPEAEALIREVLGGEPFSDGRLGPGTEAVLRLIFREGAEPRPRAAAKVAAVLKEYAAQVQKAGVADVVGGVPREPQAAQILTDLARQFRTGDFDTDYSILRPPGRTDGDTAPEVGGGASANEPRPPILGPGDGGEGGLEPGRPGAGEAGGAGEGQGPGAEPTAAVEGVEPAPTGDEVIAEDPELKKLDTDTSNAAAGMGEIPVVPEKEQPNTIAKTVAEAAQCLIDNVGEIFG